MPKSQTHPNRLLAAISQKSRKHLLSTSSEVMLASKTVLHESKSRPSHAFFLTSGLASVLAVTTVGIASEVGVVGREGFVGSLHLIGPVDTPTHHCRMQIAGAAVRIPFDHLEKAFHQDEDVHQRVLEFVQVHTHILSQVAGCHSIHGASQRLTRWLLTAQDLTESSTIDITQEVLSEILGTKRVTIAAVAGGLQRDKLIEYRRGHIRISNRKGLEAVACDCYPGRQGASSGFVSVRHGLGMTAVCARELLRHPTPNGLEAGGYRGSEGKSNPAVLRDIQRV